MLADRRGWEQKDCTTAAGVTKSFLLFLVGGADELSGHHHLDNNMEVSKKIPGTYYTAVFGTEESGGAGVPDRQMQTRGAQGAKATAHPMVVLYPYLLVRRELLVCFPPRACLPRSPPLPNATVVVRTAAHTNRGGTCVGGKS